MCILCISYFDWLYSFKLSVKNTGGGTAQNLKCNRKHTGKEHFGQYMKDLDAIIISISIVNIIMTTTTTSPPLPPSSSSSSSSPSSASSSCFQETAANVDWRCLQQPLRITALGLVASVRIRSAMMLRLISDHANEYCHLI